MSSPLDSGAYRKDRSAAAGPSDRIVPTNDFSGLTSCAWALAKAAAIVPIVTAANDQALRRALEAAGVEFIDENGGGPGVRLRKRQR
jgi:hypothetical protein